jgi:hypothetical protein
LSGNRTGKAEEEKAETFASKIFKPNPREISLQEKNKMLSDDTTSATLDTLTKSFTIKEVSIIKEVIKNLNPKKAPGYELITNQILQKLPE